jgi:hypothetical protein
VQRLEGPNRPAIRDVSRTRPGVVEEMLAKRYHEEWLEKMEDLGHHPPSYCTSFGCGCDKCCPDMVLYDDLPEESREEIRSRIRTGLT